MALKIDIDNSSIIQLRGELKRLKDELASATDPKQMQSLAEAAGEVKDRMADVNEQINQFAAGSPFERASIQLGDVKSAILNLDFGKAATSASNLSKTINTISFKQATAGLKDMGTTFVQLGKSLLTNPLFLLAAVIAAIVFAIIELLKKAGIMKVIMEQVGKVMEVVQVAIDAVVQAMKDLADWFGITNNAAEDAAKVQAESAKKVSEAYEESSKSVIQSLDNEIRMAKLNGEETERLERQKLEVLRETASKRLEASEAELRSAKLSRELKAEEIAELEKQVRENRRLYNQSISDIEYFNAQQLKVKADADKKDKEDREKSAADAAKRAAERRKKELEALQRFEQQRLTIQRQFEDINISFIADETERAIEQNRVNYSRQLEDLTKAKTDELNLLTQTGLKGEELEKRRAQVTQEYRQLSLGAELQFKDEENRIITEREKKRTDENNTIIANIAALELARKDAVTRELFELDKKEKDGLALLQQARDNGLLSQEAFELKRLELETYYSGLRTKVNETEAERLASLEAKKRDDIIKGYEDRAAAAQGYVNSAASFINTLFDIEENVGDESEAAQEERAKKRFMLNKAVAISEALIKTSLAVASALANPPAPPFSIPQAIAAGVFGAAQVAAIASQPFKGSGTGAKGGGGAGATPSPANMSNMQLFPSQVSLPQTQTQINSGMDTGGKNEMIVKAYVSETDITKTQNRINKIERLSEL